MLVKTTHGGIEPTQPREHGHLREHNIPLIQVSLTTAQHK